MARARVAFYAMKSAHADITLHAAILMRYGCAHMPATPVDEVLMFIERHATPRFAR